METQNLKKAEPALQPLNGSDDRVLWRHPVQLPTIFLCRRCCFGSTGGRSVLKDSVLGPNDLTHLGDLTEESSTHLSRSWWLVFDGVARSIK